MSLNRFIEEKTAFKKSSSLEEIPFYVLISKINREKLSGKLVISRGDRVKHVYFDKGNPISIKSNLTAESLDSIIVRMGFSSREKMLGVMREIEKASFLENLDHEQKLFLYLKDKKHVSGGDLNLCLKQQFYERLLNLFGWFNGHYTFEKDSHLIYSLSTQTVPLAEIYTEIQNLLYPKIQNIKPSKELPAIQGNFKDTFFPSLAKTLIASGITGKLVLQKKDRTKELRMHNGTPVSITSDHPSERIAKTMLRLGMIKRDEWLDIEEESKFYDDDAAERAYDKGLISNDDQRLLKALTYSERYLELFSWRSGLYHFEKRKALICPGCSTQIQIKTGLNPADYSCPKCGERLPGKPGKKIPSQIAPKKKGFTPVSKQMPNMQTEEKLKPQKQPRKDEISGVTPLELFCSECGKLMDPILKKCLDCADETLLDSFQIRELEKPSSAREGDLPPAHESQFGILANNIMAFTLEKNLKAIAFVGPGKTGKSFLALNSAFFISDNFSKKTLLVDANFQNPSLSGPLEVRPEYGLYEVLNRDVEVENAIYETAYSNLFLLPIKRRLKIVSDFPKKGTFHRIFAVLSKTFDFLIVDTGEMKNSALASYLLHSCDGLLMVARKGRTTEKDLKKFIQTLGKTGKIIGTVLNHVD